MKLKALLEAKAKGLPISADMLQGLSASAIAGAQAAAAGAGAPVIEEKVIEKEVVVETGISPEHLKELEEKAKEEAEKLAKLAEKENEDLTAQKV